LPAVADITGPRTVRARPLTVAYASRKMWYARSSGTAKKSCGPVSRSTNM
jgi:hypothetical protein